MDNRISLLRILACFLVVTLHLSASMIYQFGGGWWAANFFDSFSRVCVPLFFMISGATLLPKIEPVTDFLRKRLVRIFPPLIAWSCFYLWWLSRNHAVTGNWLKSIATGPVMYHLWFFYALIGLYALIPLLRRFYQSSTFSERLWTLIVWFGVSSLAPTIWGILNFKSCGFSAGDTVTIYHLSHFSGYAGYLLLGAMLAQTKGNTRINMALYIVGSLATMMAFYFHARQIGQVCESSYNYLSPFVIIAACGLFAAVMSQPSKKPSQIFQKIADCTLGVYCLHIFIIGAVLPRLHMAPLNNGYAWLTIPAASAFAFVISMCLIFLARRVPALRYIL